jgi:hypothetical protein
LLKCLQRRACNLEFEEEESGCEGGGTEEEELSRKKGLRFSIQELGILIHGIEGKELWIGSVIQKTKRCRSRSFFYEIS